MHDINQIQESWSKKRIITGLLILSLLAAGGYYIKTNYFNKGESGMLDKVKGANIVDEQEDSKIQNQDSAFSIESPNVSQKLESIKERVNNLNVSDITASSPYMQRIINDLQSLEQIPKNQAREACFNICKGL